MNWTEVQIKTTNDLEAAVSDILYESGATGLAIEDPRDILDLVQSEIAWDFIDPNLIDLKADEIIIKAYFAEDGELENIINNIKKRLKEHPVLSKEKCYLNISSLDEKDWAESWKKHYKPIKIGRNLLVKPTWEDVDIEEDKIVIELDPGMAFGTGTHETTTMCAEALEKYTKAKDLVYDIGCGSGILSVVAAKLGARKVVGVDLDPICVRVSKENVKINNVEDIVEVRLGDLLEVLESSADIIVSNIIAEIIVEMTPSIKKYLKDKGIFIGSGIIIEKISLVENTLLENGFEILEIIKKGEWACIIATNLLGE